jgi:TonB-linked SusC/RagA family outer membrane protein
MEIFTRIKKLCVPLKPLLFFLSCMFPLLSTAQTEPPATINSRLEGQVVDAATKEALPGVSVSILGTTHSVSTSTDGRFRFITGQNFPYTLIVNFVGYERQEVVANSSPVKIFLKERISQLNEVVVTDGYFTQTKKSYTGSATTIKGADNENKPYATPLAALQGEVPGLNIALTSGQPGANAQVRLRGLGSTALNSNPLYVIDGMIINAGDLSRLAAGVSNSSNVLAGLNEDDIESVTVLKDAAATAIYGSRGSNGVIIFTTKKGKSGRVVINFDTELGTTQNIPLPEAGRPLNAAQFSTLFIEGLRNAGTYTEAQIAALAESYGFNSGKTTDWQDLIHRNGKQQQYNISLRGGNENTKIFASAGYFNQEATTIGSSLKRLTGLLNIEQKISNRVRLSSGLNASNVYQLSPVGSTGSWSNPVFAASILRPFQLAYNDDGSLNSSSSGNTGFVAHYNPLYIAANDKHNLSQTRVLGNTTLTWDIWDKLKFTSFGSIDYNVLEESQFYNPILGEGQSSSGSATDAYTRYFNWLVRNQLDYRYNIPGVQDFYLDLAAGYEAQTSSQYVLYGTGTGFPLTQTSLTDLSNAATPTAASGANSNYDFNSVYFRASVNYRNIYSLSGSFRRDGSSLFGVNNRYGSFWAAGGAWNIDQEQFFKGQSILSTAKLRVSYGTTGNAQGIGNYAAQALASYGSNYTSGNGQNYSGVGNPDLTWEKQKKFDIGIDAGFFNDRLVFTADYYRNDIFALIQAVSISRVTGFSSVPYANSGSMQNKGFELGIKAIPLKIRDFTWSTSFNIARNDNKVTDVGNNATTANGNYYFSKGYDYYTYYTRLYAGVDPANGTALWYTDGTKSKTTTDYSAAQRVPYKSSTPKYFGGFSNTFNYKGIALTGDFYYNFGNYISDGWSTRFYDGAYYTFNKYQREFTNRWTTPGQITDVPKYIAGGGAQSNSQAFSSRFLYKGDFIRLKNVSLGYDFKKLSFLKDLPGLSKLYVYVRGTNLWTKTYDEQLPYDPESGTVTIPQFRTYTIGLNAGF